MSSEGRLVLGAAAAWLAITAIATVANGLTLRAGLYLGKQAEYLVIFWLFVRDADARRMQRAFLVCAWLSVAWASWQLVTRSFGPLVVVPVPEGVWSNVQRGTIYSVTLLGEPSPFAASVVFGLFAYVAYAGAWFGCPTERRWLLPALGAVCSALSVLSGEKIGLVMFVSGMCLLLWMVPRRTRDHWVTLFVSIALVLSTPLVHPVAKRPFRAAGYALSYITEDRGVTWLALGRSALSHSLLGVGAGRLYPKAANPQLATDGAAQSGADVVLVEEAHNMFLRTFLEAGVLGLVAFVTTLCALMIAAWRRRLEPLGAAAVAMVAAMILASLVQDAFKPSPINELFWALTGSAFARRTS